MVVVSHLVVIYCIRIVLVADIFVVFRKRNSSKTNYRKCAVFNSFPRNLEYIRKSSWNPHRPMGIHYSPHTHPTPIPMGIPMGIPIPTAALLIGAMVCLLAAPSVQLSVSTGNGWPHKSLWHHWLMPIICWSRRTSLTHVSGAITSVHTFIFTFTFRYLPGRFATGRQISSYSIENYKLSDR